MQNEETPTPPIANPDNPVTPVTTPPPVPPSKSYKKLWAGLIILFVLMIAMTAAIIWKLTSDHKTTSSKSATTAINQSSMQGSVISASKNYGNKYANGILPVGDNKYQTDGAKQGYVYACAGYAQNMKSSQGGAGTRGPWFSNNNTEYDINKKPKVQGSVKWTSVFNNQVSGDKRIITGNGLPNHVTGVYPIAASDPAYAYDKNPNSIKAQTLNYELTLSPTYGTPQCMGGQSGVMLTGAPIFNGFDAAGRDAGAWEVQDQCQGHPEKTGQYHYHTLSSCIADVSAGTIIGYALDGFPITGPKISDNNILTTADLDECHGISSSIPLGSRSAAIYHYVMTQDFPYSVSCFRATPIKQTPPAPN